MKVAGVLSGTSADGIDIAILEFEHDFKVLGCHFVPYPADVRAEILAVSNANTQTGTIARLNFLLGELFAEAIQSACKKLGLPLAGLHLIGSHGQTIFHEGEATDYFGYRIASTMQIGEPAIIAKRTAVPVLSDFRCDDIAAGGKGAPLVPIVDYRLFRDPKIGRIALNIGGISNITVIPAGAALEEIIAFDTGPGNMVIDAVMGDDGFDRGGETARRGHVDQGLLDTLLVDSYYSRQPPKTAGREQYGAEFVAQFSDLSREDAAATATELTVRTIADAVKAYAGIAEVIASGGGTHNSLLMERLKSSLPQHQLKTSVEFGIDVDAKEAIAFAVLAYESFHGRAGNVPSATGAGRAVILGKGSVP